MVRQTYINRLALGRSAFEQPTWQEGERPQDTSNSHDYIPILNEASIPLGNLQGYIQRYDIRGHPQNLTSRTLNRRFRKAQNDVLTTVGVCVSVDKNGKLIPASSINPAKEGIESERVAMVIRENAFGLWLRMADDVMYDVATFFVGALCQRIQTFPAYAGIPLSDIIRLEWERLGGVKFLFAGLPSTLIFQLLNATRQMAIADLRDALTARFTYPTQPEKERQLALFGVSLAEQIVEYLTFIAIIPIEIFACLQGLDLISALPLLPNPLDFPVKLLWQIVFPPMPSYWDLGSTTNFFVSLYLSPVPLWLMGMSIGRILGPKLQRYARIALPRPDNPDDYSIRGTPNDISYRSLETTIKAEIMKDVQGIINSFCKFQLFISFGRLKGAISDILQVLEDHAKTNQSQGLHADDVESIHASSSNFISEDQRTIIEVENGSSVVVTAPISGDTEIRSTTTLSPQLSAATDQDFNMRDLDRANVQITTRTGSTDTLHMSVEVNSTLPGAPVFTSSFSASPRSTASEPVVQSEPDEPQHRVTGLTTYPTDIFAIRFVNLFCSVLDIPIGSIFLRAVARRYFTYNHLYRLPPVWAPLHKPRAVYQVGPLLGAGLRAGVLPVAKDHATKMLICVGLEAVIGFFVWEVGFAIAWLAGKKRYRWGRL